MPGTFFPAIKFKRNRELAIPACITARAWGTCRDACRDCLPAVAGKTFSAFPAHAHPQFYVFGKRPMDRQQSTITDRNIRSMRDNAIITTSGPGYKETREEQTESTVQLSLMKCIYLMWTIGVSTVRTVWDRQTAIFCVKCWWKFMLIVIQDIFSYVKRDRERI